MKKRILVMNGSRIVQSDNGEGWITDKVEKERSIKAGIYNIYTATPADKSRPSAGAVIYSDKEAIYQQCGKKFIMHSLDDFDIVPVVGSVKSIEYDAAGKAVVSDSSIKQSRRRSR